MSTSLGRMSKAQPVRAVAVAEGRPCVFSASDMLAWGALTSYTERNQCHPGRERRQAGVELFSERHLFSLTGIVNTPRECMDTQHRSKHPVEKIEKGHHTYSVFTCSSNVLFLLLCFTPALHA